MVETPRAFWGFDLRYYYNPVERNKYGQLLDKGVLYRLLNNRVYIGDAVHKGTAYPGEHEAIVDRGLWDKARAILKESPRKERPRTELRHRRF